MPSSTLLIPIIDFEPFTTGTEVTKHTVVSQIRQACQEIGFFYLKNHSIPDTLIEQSFIQSEMFFSLPSELKNRLAWSSEACRSKTGYIAVEQERLDISKPGDLKEGLDLSKHGLATWDWSICHGAFQPTMTAFYHACTDVANQVLRALAIALNLPEFFFVERHRGQEHELLMLHYPPVTHEPQYGQLRAGEHTDYGTVSLVFQREMGGLEVQTRQGEWIAVPPIPDTIVINVADLLQRWTNHLFASSKHRVIPPLGSAQHQSRYSIIFFCNPDSNIEVSCLENCISPENPPIYPPVLAGEYIEGLLQSTIGLAQPLQRLHH